MFSLMDYELCSCLFDSFPSLTLFVCDPVTPSRVPLETFYNIRSYVASNIWDTHTQFMAMYVLAYVAIKWDNQKFKKIYTIANKDQEVDSYLYHKRGKIRWAKHSWFQPYEVFCGNTFTMHWPPVFITYLKLIIHRKTFAVNSKTAKTVKV